MSMVEKEDRKFEKKRLCIYLLLSFGLSWIIFLVSIANGIKFDGSSPYMEAFVGLGMLMPLIANIFTRGITKEGFAMTGRDSLMLGINLKNKRWKYYVFAMLIPWLYFEIMYILACILVPASFQTGILEELGISKELVFVSPVFTIYNCAIASFAALGEEGGWRGYMMPKLIKLIGLPKAIVAGGIIWGIWHAPLTCVGHNFGTDYVGFPYVGIIIMCVDCTLMGIMLTYITMKTNSIWPAAIMHAVNNGNPSALKYFINTEVFEQSYPGPVYSWLLMAIPLLIIDVLIIKKEIRKNRLPSD